MRHAQCDLIWMLLMVAALADPASVRVAVISDAENKDLAALVTMELSGNPDIILVERDDLAKVGDELKLQQLAGSDAVALGKIVEADGLIFIGKRTDGIQIRLTAVGLGYALLDDQIQGDQDLAKVAKSIAHLVVGYAPKLKLDPAKAIPISLLNLRADTASEDSDKIERSVTLLLESRLASMPEYVVLERRHAWSLKFERSLDAAPPSLLRGALLIDGAFSLPSSQHGTMVIHMRMRSPKEGESEASVSGATSDLPGLADKIAEEIRKRTGSTGPSVGWQPQKEAGEYLDEGIWAWKHGTSDEALEALDSAELLGETSLDLLAARINVLCERAGEGMGNPDSGQKPLPSSFDSRADDLRRAFSEIALYRQQKSALRSSPPKPGPPRRTDMSEDEVLAVTSRLLFYMDENEFAHADDLRLALRQVSGYDPLHGKLGAASKVQQDPDINELYSDEWPQTLEEQLAYYHLVCAPLGWFSSRPLFRHGEGFCRRFLKTPDAQKRAFAQFVESLQNVPDGRLAYLLFKSQSSDPNEADQAFSAYVDELWNRRDDAVQSNSFSPVWEMPVEVGHDILTRNAGKMVPLLRYFLTHSKDNNASDSILRLLWQPDGWSEAEARAVWPDYQVFKAVVTEHWKVNGNTMTSLPFHFAQYEDPFRKKFPLDLPVTNSVADNATSLVIHRFWCAQFSPQAPRETAHYGTWDLTKDGLWMTCGYDGRSNLICRVDLPTLRTEVIELPPGVDSQNIRVSSDAAYIDYSIPNSEIHGLARYDFATKTWTLRPISLPISKFYLIGDDIYLDLWSLKANPHREETGVARYDWNSGQITLLASSRRKPAQNQFDDRSDAVRVTFSQALDIFAGPGGKPCMTTSEGTFYIQDQPGDWQAVFDAAFGGQPLTLNDKTLIATHDGEVVLLSPNRKSPEYLMACQVPSFRKMQPKAVKEIAPWADKTFWDAPAGAQFGADGYCNDNIGFHGDRFFVLVASSTKIKGDYELLVYTRNSGRAPRHIPLQFQFDPATRQFLDSIYRGANEKNILNNIEHPGDSLFRPDLIATAQGLCFHLFAGGLWLLPYEDIEAYLKAHPLDQSDSALSAKTRINVPKIDANPTGGDTPDPGDPSSFR